MNPLSVHPKPPRWLAPACLLWLAVLGVSTSHAAETPAAAMRLLKAQCFSCHNDEKQKGGLAMTSREALLKGGENGAALVSGAPEKSALVEALDASADPHMPPKKQLSVTQRELLSRWIAEGAPWDSEALRTFPQPPRPVTLSALPGTYRPVLAMALSPDGRRLALGCGNELVLLDVSSPKCTILARASAHPDAVQSLAWSADGKRLASGAFRRVVIWETDSLTVEREITAGLSDRICALRFFPDGNELIAADGRVSECGTVRLIDVAAGGIDTSWPAHTDTIFDLALSADGRFLATAGGDKLVKIWDLATLREVARLEGHMARVLTLSFNGDATRLLTGGADSQLKVWDVTSGESLMSLGQHSSAINAATWAANGGSAFAISEAGGVVRYTEFKAHSGGQFAEAAQEKKFSEVGTALYSMAASGDGERVFAGSHDGRLFTWNKSGKLLEELSFNPPAVAAGK